ncbi:MAG: PA0069 family radical SAM protein [Bdellovibrionota bacterium]
MNDHRKNIKGRGATENPANRWERLHYSEEYAEPNIYEEETNPRLKTEFFKDTSKTVLTQNKSPDIGFNFSVNPYRGCEHGCAYCYARPTHEYLGYSAGLDFESKIFVKENAPELLREKLMSKSWEPATIAMSGITDCYQPIERKLEITRRCLQVLNEFKNPVAIITKNALVTRDVDILSELASVGAAEVFISVTTLDSELCGFLEPRTSRPTARLKAIETLAKAGIPVGVNVAPVIPGLTDHEMPSILKAAADAGATSAGYVPLRLPTTVLTVFTQWLDTHRPDRKEKILSAIRDIRGGKLNDANFGSRMSGQGPVADNMKQMFQIYSRREHLNEKDFHLSTASFQRPVTPPDQLSFLD